MEVDSDHRLEEQLQLAGGEPPGWGQLDLSQLRTPPPPTPSPPRTAARRGRRRLSGILPCSSHRMTLRRRSGVAPLSPVERSLDALQLSDETERRLSPSPTPGSAPARVPADASPPAPPLPPPSPPPATQAVEEPASARRSGRRRSLVPLNAPPPPAAGRKSRRRSFGGRSASERTVGDMLDVAGLVDGAGKENGWLDVGSYRSSPSPPPQTGLKRSLAAFEAESLAVVTEQPRGENTAADGSGTENGLVPGLPGCDETVTGPVIAGAEDRRVVPEPAPATDKPRRPAAGGRRQRRRSAGGALMGPVRVPREAADSPEADRARIGSDTAAATFSLEKTMDTATATADPAAFAGTSAAVTSAAAPAAADTPATAAAAAAPPATCAKPAETLSRLPPELEEYYRNRNYQPPAPSHLPTIAEEEAPAPRRPIRAARRRCADPAQVRKCSMELTPAKQRLRKLKAQRVNSLNKARSRRGRPGGVKKLLDAKLKELDLFYQEEEAREREREAAREREEAAAAAAAAEAARSEDRATEEPMDVETPPLPSESPPPSPGLPPPSSSGRTPLGSPEPMTPPPLAFAPSLPPSPSTPPLPPRAPLPDLDATYTGGPRPCTDLLADSSLSFSSALSSGGGDLLLELTRSSADSSLSYGRLSGGPAAAAVDSPVIVGGGELNLAALRRPSRFSEGEEAVSPCLGGRLNRAVLLSPEDDAA